MRLLEAGSEQEAAEHQSRLVSAEERLDRFLEDPRSFAGLPLDLVIKHKRGKTHITLRKRKQSWRHDFALVVYISELPKLSESIGWCFGFRAEG